MFFGDCILFDEHNGGIFLLIAMFVIEAVVFKAYRFCISYQFAILGYFLNLTWLSDVTLHTAGKCCGGIEKVLSLNLFPTTQLRLLDTTIFSTSYTFFRRFNILFAYIIRLFRVGVARFRQRRTCRKFLVNRLEPVRVFLIAPSFQRSLFNDFDFSLPACRRLRGIA